MNGNDLYKGFNEVDDDILERSEIVSQGKRKPVWLKWGAIAACLCLVVVGFTGLLHQDFQISGGGDLGGVTSGDGDYYSVAVYPASETIANVASAEVVSLTEHEMLSNELAAYLPKQLPEGFHYGRGSIYHTVMKDGTQYIMLRVEYISGIIPEQQFTEDGGAIAPNPDAIGDLFIVCVMNYEPDIKFEIYSSIDEVTISMFEESGCVCIRLENCYVSVFSETATPEAVLETVKNIG